MRYDVLGDFGALLFRDLPEYVAAYIVEYFMRYKYGHTLRGCGVVSMRKAKGT